MLVLADDWGNPSPTGAGTDWFGFAALFLKDDQIRRMRTSYANICEILGRRPDRPLHLRKLGLDNKYHITKLIAQSNPAISIVCADPCSHFPKVTATWLGIPLLCKRNNPKCYPLCCRLPRASKGSLS